MICTFIELGHYGQMGNALFEAAATIGYAKKYNVPFIFPKWDHQEMFQIPSEFFINKNEIKFTSKYTEPGFVYSEIPFQPDCSLFGYFQSWKYFDHCKEYIREIFTPKNPEDPRYFEGVCCVHVRRGDYLKFPEHHPTQTVDYYMKAMEKIPAKRFLVFSDDVAWCKQNFKSNEFIVTDPAPASVHFRMMVACNYFCIANSSFSWWAAWVSNHQNKVVVAPKNWFGPKYPNSPIIDLIPPEWILI
jgi:hypothetical protein